MKSKLFAALLGVFTANLLPEWWFYLVIGVVSGCLAILAVKKRKKSLPAMFLAGMLLAWWLGGAGLFVLLMLALALGVGWLFLKPKNEPAALINKGSPTIDLNPTGKGSKRFFE